MNLASYIDHTILKPTTQESDIAKLCEEAVQYEFAAVCVPPPAVALAKKLTQGSSVKVATVIGFPFGYQNTNAKYEECKQAIQDGADELDMVVNLMDIKAKNWDAVGREWSTLLQIVRLHNKVLKVIIESGELTDEEIIQCCHLANKHKVDFLKTSTGYASQGASVHAVSLMRQYLDTSIQIKASGGIRDKATATAMIQAGANRIGASASVAIVQG